MVFGNCYVVQREAGPGTVPGTGDVLIDNHGNRYQQIDPQDAAMIRNSTGGQVFTLHPDGRIGGGP